MQKRIQIPFQINDGESVEDAMTTLRAIVESIPPEFRALATYESLCEAQGGEFVYVRPETDAERSERETREASYRADRDAREMAEYERLRAKFGK